MSRFITTVLVLSLVFVPGVLFAQDATTTQEALLNPGISPDSPFYFLDSWGEGLSLAFTRGQEARAQKRAQFAEERLAEAQQMAEEDKPEAAERAAESYGELMSQAASGLSAAAQEGEGVDEALENLITRATSIHLDVLVDVYERVPQQAKSAIERAMQESTRGQETALNALSGERRGEVEQMVQQRQAEVEQRLQGLRDQGVPVPSIFGDETPAGQQGAPQDVQQNIPEGAQQNIPDNAQQNIPSQQQVPTQPGTQDASTPEGTDAQQPSDTTNQQNPGGGAGAPAGPGN